MSPEDALKALRIASSGENGKATLALEHHIQALESRLTSMFRHKDGYQNTLSDAKEQFFPTEHGKTNRWICDHSEYTSAVSLSRTDKHAKSDLEIIKLLLDCDDFLTHDNIILWRAVIENLESMRNTSREQNFTLNLYRAFLYLRENQYIRVEFVNLINSTQKQEDAKAKIFKLKSHINLYIYSINLLISVFTALKNSSLSHRHFDYSLNALESLNSILADHEKILSQVDVPFSLSASYVNIIREFIHSVFPQEIIEETQTWLNQENPEEKADPKNMIMQISLHLNPDHAQSLKLSKCFYLYRMISLIDSSYPSHANDDSDITVDTYPILIEIELLIAKLIHVRFEQLILDETIPKAYLLADELTRALVKHKETKAAFISYTIRTIERARLSGISFSLTNDLFSIYIDTYSDDKNSQIYAQLKEEDILTALYDEDKKDDRNTTRRNSLNRLTEIINYLENIILEEGNSTNLIDLYHCYLPKKGTVRFSDDEIFQNDDTKQEPDFTDSSIFAIIQKQNPSLENENPVVWHYLIGELMAVNHDAAIPVLAIAIWKLCKNLERLLDKVYSLLEQNLSIAPLYAPDYLLGIQAHIQLAINLVRYIEPMFAKVTSKVVSSTTPPESIILSDILKLLNDVQDALAPAKNVITTNVMIFFLMKEFVLNMNRKYELPSRAMTYHEQANHIFNHLTSFLFDKNSSSLLFHDYLYLHNLLHVSCSAPNMLKFFSARTEVTFANKLEQLILQCYSQKLRPLFSKHSLEKLIEVIKEVTDICLRDHAELKSYLKTLVKQHYALLFERDDLTKAEIQEKLALLDKSRSSGHHKNGADSNMLSKSPPVPSTISSHFFNRPSIERPRAKSIGSASLPNSDPFNF